MCNTAFKEHEFWNQMPQFKAQTHYLRVLRSLDKLLLHRLSLSFLLWKTS